MGVRAIQVGSTSAAHTRTAAPRGPSRRDLATLQALGRPLDAHNPTVIRNTAAQMVSELFFVPLLAQMRAFPFGNEIGHGGPGEAAFAQQLDQRVADAVAGAERGGLVDQLAQRLEKAAHKSTPAPPPQTAWLTQLRAHERLEGHHDGK